MNLIWSNWSEFFAMGGYGLYVWGSYGLAALPMVVAPWPARRRHRRALQAPALKAWAGLPANLAVAQQRLLHRAQCNGAARFGKYSGTMEAA